MVFQNKNYPDKHQDSLGHHFAKYHYSSYSVAKLKNLRIINLRKSLLLIHYQVLLFKILFKNFFEYFIFYFLISNIKSTIILS